MSGPFTPLPYIPGLSPPTLPATPAVGFTESSVTAQTDSVTSNGRTNQYLVKTVTQILNDTIEGQAVIQILGGAPLWIGFANTVTPLTGFRLVVDDPFTMRKIIPVWAIGLSDDDIAPSLIQVSLVE